MVNIEFANAYTQVYEILKYLEKDEFNKIPKEVIEGIDKKRNIDYIFHFNPNISIDEYDLIIDAKAILFYLFYKYLANSEQVQKINEIRLSIKKNDEIKKAENYKKYFEKNLFKQKDSKYDNCNNSNFQENTELVVYKESFVKKIIKMIKELFKKK